MVASLSKIVNLTLSRKMMVAHQQGFPCVYAKQVVSHKGQAAGQAEESCETRLALQTVLSHDISLWPINV